MGWRMKPNLASHYKGGGGHQTLRPSARRLFKNRATSSIFYILYIWTNQSYNTFVTIVWAVFRPISDSFQVTKMEKSFRTLVVRVQFDTIFRFSLLVLNFSFRSCIFRCYATNGPSLSFAASRQKISPRCFILPPLPIFLVNLTLFVCLLRVSMDKCEGKTQ